MKTGGLIRRQHFISPLSCGGLKAGGKGPDKKETAFHLPIIQQGLKAGSRDPDKETASISPIILRRPESR